MSNVSILIMEICVLLLQVTASICNGCILFIFFKVERIRKNAALRLILFLVCADFLHAVTTLPYSVYMVTHWHPTHFSLDPYYIVFASVFFIAQLKINLTLTISIALERTLAIFFPMTYRKMPSSEYAMACLLTGCLLATIDVVLDFVYFPFENSPNCGSVGCFVTSNFSRYWGTSNMVMGFIVILLTAVLIAKLQLVERESKSRRTVMNSESKRFQQANRTSAGILLTSLVFVTIPSIFVGIVDMLGYSTFRKVGPFYLTGLLSAGACNAIVYIVLNRDMRDLAKGCFFNKVSDIKSLMPPTRIFSTTILRNINLR
ncbi:hypothetical protein V3C99_012055 [Haemonchus contortus]